MGVYKALVDHAFNAETGEGPEAALGIAEKWRDVLEDIWAVCDEKEKISCGRLLRHVNQAITSILVRRNNETRNDSGSAREDQSPDSRS